MPTINDESLEPELIEDSTVNVDHTLGDTHCMGDGDDQGLTADDPLPSLHKIKQKAKEAGRSTLRSALITSITENSSIPLDQLCTICNSTEATFRCVQCGPCAYYCCQCLNEWHSWINIFHTPEEWKVVTHVLKY